MIGLLVKVLCINPVTSSRFFWKRNFYQRVIIFHIIIIMCVYIYIFHEIFQIIVEQNFIIIVLFITRAVIINYCLSKFDLFVRLIKFTRDFSFVQKRDHKRKSSHRSEIHCHS